MSAFHKIIASVRSALERKVDTAPFHPDNGVAALPSSAAARRAELTAQFGRELERVGGHFYGSLTKAEARDRAVTIAAETAARSAIVGAGVTFDADLIAKGLARNRVEVIRPDRLKEKDRAATRDRVANCELGVIEADYAIAGTGTFCVVATAHLRLSCGTRSCERPSRASAARGNRACGSSCGTPQASGGDSRRA